MSAWKYDERAYPSLEFWRGRPVGEADDEQLQRKQYEEQQTEGGNGSDDGDHGQ